MKCPPKNTGLCLAEYSKIFLSHHAKGPILVRTKLSKRLIMDMDRGSVGGEEFQRAGTEEMHN